MAVTVPASRLLAPLLLLAVLAGPASAQQPAAPDPLAARVDPYVEKQRVVVMTDIANEPDDQMSMVRFLVYSNHFDVEGLIATTSTWMKNKVRPDVIQTLLGAYEQVLPKLLQQQPGFPSGESLRAVVVSGQPAYGMAAVGPDKSSAGSDLIVSAAEKAEMMRSAGLTVAPSAAELGATVKATLKQRTAAAR